MLSISLIKKAWKYPMDLSLYHESVELIGK